MYAPYNSSELGVLLEAVKGIAAVAVPVAIGVFALLLGVDYIPTIINKFRHGDSLGNYWKDGVEYDSDGIMLGNWEDYYNEDGSKRWE